MMIVMWVVQAQPKTLSGRVNMKSLVAPHLGSTPSSSPTPLSSRVVCAPGMDVPFPGTLLKWIPKIEALASPSSAATTAATTAQHSLPQTPIPTGNAYTNGFVTPPPVRRHLGSAGVLGGALTGKRKLTSDRKSESRSALTKRARKCFTRAAECTANGNALSKLAEAQPGEGKPPMGLFFSLCDPDRDTKNGPSSKKHDPRAPQRVSVVTVSPRRRPAIHAPVATALGAMSGTAAQVNPGFSYELLTTETEVGASKLSASTQAKRPSSALVQVTGEGVTDAMRALEE